MGDNVRLNGAIHIVCAQEHRKQLPLSLPGYNIEFKKLQGLSVTMLKEKEMGQA